MSVLKILISAVLLTTGLAVSSYAFDRHTLDTYLELLNEYDKAMLTVTLSERGDVVYQKAVGNASIKEGIPNEPDTRFRIGSITKTFTAVMILQLVEAGDLSLDTMLSEYFPASKNANRITVKQLLGHRSGIESITDTQAFRKIKYERQTRKSMLEHIYRLKSVFEPDSKVEYSNTNYLLLGYILEELTGKSYSANLEERITGPLDLEHTYYGKPMDPHAGEAHSYRWQGGGWTKVQEEDMSIPHGAGAIVSTTEDVNRFLWTLLSTEKLLSEASRQAMFPKQGRLGFGLMTLPFNGHLAYGHNGGIDGFASMSGFFPHNGLGFAVFFNGVNLNPNAVVIGILSIYQGMEFELPDFEATAIALSAEQLESYAGAFSSKEIPLKLKLFLKNGQLVGQASGQGAFLLTPFSEREFRFERAGIVFEFQEKDGRPDFDRFLLKQAGRKRLYERD